MNLKLILTSGNVVDCINNNLEYLLTIIPELKFMLGFLHKHPHHHLDVWEHTLLALKLSENDFEIRLTLLLHDIGKPFSYQEGKIRHFKNHADVSSKMANNILKRLDFDDKFIKEVCYLIKNHDIPITINDILKNKELVFKRYKVQYCDALAHHPEKLEKRIEYLNDIREKLNDVL